MQHRHLTADAGWSKAAIDSVLERGDLAANVIEVAQQHLLPGSALVIHLAENSRGCGS